MGGGCPEELLVPLLQMMVQMKDPRSRKSTEFTTHQACDFLFCRCMVFEVVLQSPFLLRWELSGLMLLHMKWGKLHNKYPMFFVYNCWVAKRNRGKITMKKGRSGSCGILFSGESRKSALLNHFLHTRDSRL